MNFKWRQIDANPRTRITDLQPNLANRPDPNMIRCGTYPINSWSELQSYQHPSKADLIPEWISMFYQTTHEISKGISTRYYVSHIVQNFLIHSRTLTKTFSFQITLSSTKLGTHCIKIVPFFIRKNYLKLSDFFMIFL